MILSYWYLFILTILITLLLSWIFKRLQFVSFSYKNSKVPYAGGTIVLICIISGYFISFLGNRISFFKLSCFSVSLFLIYALGIFYDLYGEKNKKGLLGSIIGLFHRKFSVEIIEAGGIIGISSYIYLFFNEEYWFIKALLTLVIMNFFNILEKKPGRTIKAYYFFFIFLAMTPLRWTRDLYYISFAVFSALYYFDAFCLTAMGRSGSNLSGLIVGLMITEAISTSFAGIVTMIIVLILIQASLNRYPLILIMKKSRVLDYMDRILTERQNGENVKSQ